VDHKTLNEAFARREFLKVAGLAAAGLAFPEFAFAHVVARRSGELPVYVGTYTSGKSEGIYLYRLNLSSGELKHAGTTKGVKDPSFLALAPNRRFLYAVNELEEFGGQKSGAVSAFAVDQRTGELRLLNQQPSLGGAPCHVDIDLRGRFVLVANYVGGNVAVLPVKRDGSLGTAIDMKQAQGSGPNRERQKGPHAHCIVLDRANRFAYSCDLGTDKIMIFRFDARSGKLAPNEQPARIAAPVLVMESCAGFFRPQPTENFEAILAQAEAKTLASIPGAACLKAVEPCRTWICQYTRAVPHGSFL